MKKKTIFMALVALALSTVGNVTADAQSRRKAAAKKQPVLTEEEKARIERMEEMQYATQKTMFIDSVVVDKDKIFNAVNLPSEAGSFALCDNIFGDGTYSDIVFVNEMGNRCFFPGTNTDGSMSIFASDRLDGKWSAPVAIGGLEELGGDARIFSPFMMADGITLYFAATGQESIGGYDIFVTRYNADENRFFKPENIGMPFNSTANDYFYLVDEYDGIGWFATDRNQPEGKVCIYTFVPTETRETYDDIDEAKLRQLASLHSIADTWHDANERQSALQRLKAAAARQQDNGSARKDAFAFVVNDNTVYTSISQFKAEGNLERFVKLTDLKTRLEKYSDELDRHRQRYAVAEKSAKGSIGGDILARENECESLERQIKQLEKEIRNAENKEMLR